MTITFSGESDNQFNNTGRRKSGPSGSSSSEGKGGTSNTVTIRVHTSHFSDFKLILCSIIIDLIPAMNNLFKDSGK